MAAVRKTVAGDTSLSGKFIIGFRAPDLETVRKMTILRTTINGREAWPSDLGGLSAAIDTAIMAAAHQASK